MSCGSCTPLPSSVNRWTPAAASSPNGASALPVAADGDAPGGMHLAQPGAVGLGAHELDHGQRCPAPGRCSASRRSAVKPPSAAARLPVSMVSASSRPGSRRCTCRSTKPGVTMQPVASRTRRRRPIDDADLDDPTVVDRRRRRDARPSGRARSPPRITRRLMRRLRSLAAGRCRDAEQVEQHRHAHSDAIGDLVEDHRAGRARPGRRPSRRHGSSARGASPASVRRSRAARSAVRPYSAEYSRSDRQQRVVHALALHAQQVQHVEVGQHARRDRG